MRPSLKNWLGWWRHRDGKAPPNEPAPREKPAHFALYERYGVPETLHYPTTTLGRVLDQTAKRFADAPAVVYGPVVWDYDFLLRRVDRLAAGLARLGVKRGERVLMTLPNCPEFVATFLAVQKTGGVVVNAGPLMGLDDLAKLMKMTTPRVVIGLDLQATTLAQAGAGRDDLHWVWVSLSDYLPMLHRLGYRFKRWQSQPDLPETQHQLTLDALLEDAPARPPSMSPESGDVALLQPTGGTTGTLKVAQLTHRNLLANAEQTGTWLRLRPGQESVLGILPMFHVYGLSTCLIAPIFNGGAIMPVTRFKLEPLIELILEHRPTVLPLVPAIIDAICERVESDESLRNDLADAIAHRLVISGAAALSPQSAARFEQLLGMPIVQGFGLTEASPVTHINPPEAPRAGSIGVPLPDTHVRVMDLHDPDRAAEPGEAGEMWISGPQTMLGYYDNEEATAGMIVERDGRRWLRTGDVASVDADGYFFVVDRKKDMINRGGMKVWPAKVERVLRMHPQVADVGVIGRPDEKYSEVVVGVIALKAQADDYDALASGLRALCREHLAPYEVPSRFEFVDSLPRSGLGKMLKYRLRDGQTPAAPPEPKSEIEPAPPADRINDPIAPEQAEEEDA